jgi:hypothetical protein
MGRKRFAEPAFRDLVASLSSSDRLQEGLISAALHTQVQPCLETFAMSRLAEMLFFFLFDSLFTISAKLDCVSGFVEMVCYLDGQTPESVEDLENNLVYAFLKGVHEVIIKGFRWIGLMRQNSLGVYIYCQSEDDLVYLTELESTGHLAGTLEEIFTKVTESSDVIRIARLEWSQDDKMRCRMYFQGLNGK